MALGSNTFSSASGAVSDLFAGFGALDQGNLRAQGLNITAAGTRTQAAGTEVMAAGTRVQAQGTRIGAEGTELSAESLRIKAGGDLAEAQNYDLAATLARQNETYTDFSTRVQAAQESRTITQTIGGVRANTGAAGFTSGGSSMDILRDSARQGALALGTLRMQGAINEAGFEEQAKSYETMSAAGRATAAGEQDIATRTDTIAGQQRGLADQQDTIAGQQDQIAQQQNQIAAQQDQLASDTRSAASKAATGDFITGAIKSVAAVASIIPGASILEGIAGAIIPGNWGEA